jgi:hypothetical protein
MKRIPIYNRQGCVNRAAAFLVRKHGTPDTALDALRPALTRLQAASVASARTSQFALLERPSIRYCFSLDVRIDLLQLARIAPTPCTVCLQTDTCTDCVATAMGGAS